MDVQAIQVISHTLKKKGKKRGKSPMNYLIKKKKIAKAINREEKIQIIHKHMKENSARLWDP